MNNFRSNLKKIIIERKKSTLTNQSIRNVRDYANKYIHLKIKSVFTRESVLSIRQYYQVLESLQFLMFGQHIGMGGNSMMSVMQSKGGADGGKMSKAKIQDQRKLAKMNE